MNKYENELSLLRPEDGINGTSLLRSSEFPYISTFGHGYLVVPIEHPLIGEARKLCEYGYKGKLAVYLEEDCEMPKFLNLAAQVAVNA